MRRGFVFACTVLGATLCVGAEDIPSQHFAAGVQVRDAAVNTERGAAYLAVYDRNEVWQINLATNETAASAQVGQGPVALALAPDGEVLACANRLSGDLSLIRSSDMSLLATVPCGDGPADVAALPGGGFAVVNSFSDSVTLVDPVQPNSPVQLTGVTGVPNGVAAGQSSLAVTIKSPASVLLFAPGSTAPVHDVALDNTPIGIAALTGDMYAVATSTAVVLLNGASGETAGRLDSPALGVACRGDEVLVLGEDAVRRLAYSAADNALNDVGTIPLGGSARSLAVGGELIVSLSPKDRTWDLYGAYVPPKEPEVVIAAAEPAPAPGDTSPMEPAADKLSRFARRADDAPSAEGAVQLPARAHRDAVVDAEAGFVYVSAYDRDLVWKTRIDRGSVVAAATPGKGPISLALSADRAVLACANHLSGTLTLFNVEDMSVIATAPCGEAPRDVAAFPGGGFAVVNHQTTDLTLIDPAHPGEPVTIACPAANPYRVEASAEVLAVAAASPPSLLLYGRGSDSAVASVSLPAAATGLCALPDNRFAVAMPGRVVVVDAPTHEVVADEKMAVTDVASAGGRLFALGDKVAYLLNDELAQEARMPLDLGGRALAAGMGASGTEAILAVLERKATLWRFRLEGGAGPRLVAHVKEPAPTEHEQQLAQASAKSALRQWRMDPPPLPEPEQKYPRKPSPTIAIGPQRKSLGESVRDSLQLGGTPGGFELPDWTKPLKDASGDHGEFSPDGNRVVITGNCRFTLDTVQFKSDYLYYDRDAGELLVRGNVEIQQGNAYAFADELRYVLSEEAKAQAPPPLAVKDSDLEQELAKKLFTLGTLDATELQLIEPARRIKMERIIYDFASQTGQAFNVYGEAGGLYFGVDRLDILGPETAFGEDLWLTTCDPDHQYYRVYLREGSALGKGAVTGKGAQLEVGKVMTPIYWPRWSFTGGETPTIGFDFDSGHSAELGYYVNVGQQFAVTPNLQLGYRFWPTTDEGIGFGAEGKYSFLETPSSPFFRSKGSFKSLYTTEKRGYFAWYHGHEIFEDTLLLAQVEQWFDPEFYKDFFYSEYRDRTEPRTFVNVTHTKDTWIATATFRKTTNGFVAETERMPEFTYHLLERRLAENLYFSFDTIDGYNEREPSGTHALRLANVGRLTYDLELRGLNFTPFAELEGTWYSDTWRDADSDLRLSTTVGATAQTRLQRAYPGRWGFSAFKHLVIPSVTFSYRPEPTMGVEETPRFDVYDNVYGRCRLESKLDNILLARDEVTGEAWQAGRLTLYYGDDFQNEMRESRDYEVELDLRPRPWWGLLAMGERHRISESDDIDHPFYIQRWMLEGYERLAGEPYDLELSYRYNAQYEDYERLLTYLYYDDRPFGGHFDGKIGFAYTSTRDQVFNREVLYGMGYQFGDKWSVYAEHRYDLERGGLQRQLYEFRRAMHCLEGAVRVEERPSGWDFGLEFTVTGIPGARLKF